MNKKSAILLFSVLVLLSLGVLYVYGTLTSDIGEKITISSAFGVANSRGDGYGVNNWTKGGLNATINFTVIMPNCGTTDGVCADWAAGGDANITRVWLELPINVQFFDMANASATNVSVLYGTTMAMALVCPEGIAELDSVLNNTNILDGDPGTYTNWTCSNTSATTLIGPDTTFYFALNFTANNTGDEEPISWNVTIEALNETNLTNWGSTMLLLTNIDAQEPRLIDINISDGNTTYANTTWGGGYTLRLGLWTIQALIEDTLLNSGVFLAYTCNKTNASWTTTEWVGATGTSLVEVTDIQANGVYDKRGWVNTTIDCTQSDLYYDATNMSNASVTFAFLANDSFNHYRVLNNTWSNTLDGPFNIWYDDGDILPTIARVNASQATVKLSDGVHSASRTLDSTTSPTIMDGTNDWLRIGNVTFNIEVTGGYRPEIITILWNSFANSTSAAAAVVNSINIGVEGNVYDLTNLDEGLMLNATNNTEGPCNAGITACTDPFLTPDSGDDYIPTVVYDSSISLATNASEHFVFWVLVNNTNNTHVTSAGPYRFQLDGIGPTMTMTAPTDRTITPRASITYSCKAADDLSDEHMIRWQLVKPGTYGTISTNFATLGTDSTQSKTFSGDDTMYPGEYVVKCIGVDQVGNEKTFTGNSESYKFTVHYTTTTAGEGEGAAAAADIDLSTAEEVTITEKQGVISTFTLDGTTVHTIKIKTVDEIAGTVTIIIESDPIEITLKIGETKEVDIDADGTNDISITLNKITDGAADITTKRLAPLPTEKPTEEVPPTEKPAEEIPTAPEAPSKTWLWILIIVIIVVIGVGYWFMKRK